MVKILRNRFHANGRRFIALCIAVMMVVGICFVKVNAITIAKLTKDDTTFTGSIVYKQITGPLGYYVMKISSSKTSQYLYENVRLKSQSGSYHDPISASGRNTKSVSTQTNEFADGYYTTKGDYYYSVKSSVGKSYTFSYGD